MKSKFVFKIYEIELGHLWVMRSNRTLYTKKERTTKIQQFHAQSVTRSHLSHSSSPIIALEMLSCCENKEKTK